MSFTKLREIRDRFEQQWINGGFIFGYENEINENHNNDYPLLLVLPPTSELPATEGDVQEEYTFECLVVKPYYQNQSGSLDVVFSLLEQEALTWLQRVLDSYTNKEVILSPDSISVEREKELYNDKLIQVRLTFTLNAFSHSLTSVGDDIIADLSPKVWLRADMGVKTHFFGGNEVVTSWRDQSANGNHFSQSTSLKQPTYRYENSTNNYPFIDFNGTTTFLSCDNNSIDGTVNGLNSEFTVAYVATSDADGDILLSKNVGSNPNFKLSTTSGKFSFTATDGGGDSITHADTSSASSAIAVRVVGLENHKIKTYLNGQLQNTTNESDYDNVDFGNSNPILLGAENNSAPTNFFDGKVQEIIIFNKKLTGDEVHTLSDYLKHKYKI
tara:strand:- start:6751 stop:7905 length:1155 start_codon:yes stop_codon:yes gene_type:complete